MAGLKWGWSPEQVANELRREEGRTVTSDESIYRFVYAQAARHKDHDWRRYLPRAKWKRGRRGRRGGSSVSFIPLRRPVAERPAAAADRRTFGHWEADTMQFGRPGEVVLALHERSSRLLLLARAPSKEAGPVAESIARILGPLLLEFRQTVTLDNGTEFTRHHELHRLGIETFFCDTYSPWQKGGVENAIGRLRRFLPRGTKLAEVSDERFAAVGLAYNNTPRKCLGYQTSAQVFEEQVLHFKCGFTFPLSRQRRRGKAADAVLLGRGHGRGAGQAPRSAAGNQSPQPRPCSSGRTPWCRLWRRIRSARSARPGASDSRRAAPEGVRGLVGVLAQLAGELLHRMCGRSPCRRCVQCPRPLNGELSEGTRVSLMYWTSTTYLTHGLACVDWRLARPRGLTR